MVLDISNPIKSAGIYYQNITGGNVSLNDILVGELLDFLYGLKDHWEVVNSKSNYISKRGWGGLDDILYFLESEGEAVFRNENKYALLLGILQDLSAGRVMLKRKSRQTG